MYWGLPNKSKIGLPGICWLVSSLQFKYQLIAHNLIYISPLVMSNPFANLPGSDEEDNAKFQPVDKNKKDAGQKKTQPVQQPKPQAQRKDTRPNVNDNLIVNQRENTKGFKSDKEQRPVKDVTDHRLHDRKSAMGRVSQPRKGGGGIGGIGNMKDELNQDKILSRVKEEGEAEQQPPKEPSPQALTLEEYYARQGLNINELDKKKQQKTEAKKDAPQPDWIAKEKLQFVKSKADNVLEGETKKVAVLKDQSHKIETAAEQDLLGFTSTAPSKRREERPAEENKERAPRENRKEEKPRGQGNERGARKYEQKRQQPQAKLVINEEDFPSL